MKAHLFNTPNFRVLMEPYSVRPDRCAIAVGKCPSTHETDHYGRAPAIAESLSFAACHDELYSGEKRFDEIFALVSEVLPDAFGNRDDGAFEFKDTDGAAVDV